MKIPYEGKPFIREFPIKANPLYKESLDNKIYNILKLYVCNTPCIYIYIYNKGQSVIKENPL